LGLKPEFFVNKGVTLLEMMMTIILVTVGMVAIMRIMSMAIFSDSGLEQKVIALNLANERMEEIKNTAFASISSGTETGSAIGFDFVDNRVVTVTDTASDLKDVEVEVQWTQKGTQQTVAVETYIADY